MPISMAANLHTSNPIALSAVLYRIAAYIKTPSPQIFHLHVLSQRFVYEAHIKIFWSRRVFPTRQCFGESLRPQQRKRRGPSGRFSDITEWSKFSSLGLLWMMKFAHGTIFPGLVTSANPFWVLKVCFWLLVAVCWWLVTLVANLVVLIRGSGPPNGSFLVICVLIVLWSLMGAGVLIRHRNCVFQTIGMTDGQYWLTQWSSLLSKNVSFRT